MKLNKNSKGRFVGLAGSSLVLGFMALAVACPTGLGAHADSCPTGSAVNSVCKNGQVEFGFTVNMLDPDGKYSETGDVNIEFKVNPTIAIGTSSGEDGSFDPDGTIADVNIDADATVNNGFAVQSTNFMVSSNSSSGFNVFVKGANDQNDLVRSDIEAAASSAPKIAPIGTTGGIPQSAFNANTWGYNVSAADMPIDDTTQYYSPLENIPPYSVRTHSSEAANLKLTIGTKVSETLAAGTYSNTIVVSAVINPVTTTVGLSEEAE